MAGVLNNKIKREDLKPGDHIYIWKKMKSYSHHGIYIGDDKVIHYNRRQGEGIGSEVLDPIISVLAPPKIRSCPNCGDQPDNRNGVHRSCLDCFLSGKKLRQYRYGVSKRIFYWHFRGGTCTMAPSDPPEKTLHRANYLYELGFGSYSLFINNCEDFTIYCKTGLVTKANLSRSGQVASAKALMKIGELFKSEKVNFDSLVSACEVYCKSRRDSDVGVRDDIEVVPVEKLASYLESAQASTSL